MTRLMVEAHSDEKGTPLGKLRILAVVVLLLLAGDAWLRATAEARVASELQSSFDPDGETEIAFGGFPFAARVISGTIPVARLTSSSLIRSGVRLSDVKMTLQDVEFSWSKIIAGEVGSVTVRAGKGSASIGERGLNRALAAVADGVRVQIEDGFLRAFVGGRSARAELTIEDTDLVLGMGGTERTVTVPLPRFVAGLRYGSVELRALRVTISFTLDEANFSNL